MEKLRSTGKKDSGAGGPTVGVEGLGGRRIPESAAAEAAVLGSMIINPACIEQVIELIRAEAFYQPHNRDIFEAIIHLYEQNKGQLDGLLVRDELEKRGVLGEIGGAEGLRRIIESVPTTANVTYYAGILRDNAMLRELIAAAEEIAQDAYSQTGDVSEKLDEAERKIFAITDKQIAGAISSIKDLVVRTYELIEKRDGRHVTGLATGFFKLDELTCGLQNGEMIIIAGRPSMGKTSLALNIAENIGVVEKTPIAIFSLEMGSQQLAERFLCSRSQLDSQMVRRGMLSTDHYHKLAEACQELSESPIYIDDSAGITPLVLRAKARRMKSRFGVRCVVLDYLQLMSSGLSRVESRQQEITAISRYIKELARELDIPVVVLSQLNRAPEGREDHKPRMSDLRESGSIEQDADVVMLLHREDYYHKNDNDRQPSNIAEVIIAKQRNGPTDKVELVFREQFTRFENKSEVPEPF